MIYVSSPYSDPHIAVRHQRFLAACKYTSRLMADGKNVFSPIVHSHWLNGLPTTWRFWAN
ncbi:hypothetical protein LCGC14_3132290, partial [marine sediment metagenome]